jgi:uncharacterized protein (DUF58 family)
VSASVALESLLDEQFLRRLERLALVTRLPAGGGLGGEHRSRARASSVDFADHRDYAPGDDFRRIDWNVYGRLGDLFVKLTEAREHLVARILLDCSASMHWGEPDKLHFARTLAAALGYVALCRNEVASVSLLGEAHAGLSELRGRGRALELLRFLDSAAPSGRLDLTAFLATLPAGAARGAHRRAQVLLLSDLLDPPLDELGAALEAMVGARLDIVVMHILAPQELEPEPGGDMELIDSETGERLRVGLTLNAVDQYKRRMLSWLNDVEGLCLRNGIRYQLIRTDESLETVVLSALRRGGILT